MARKKTRKPPKPRDPFWRLRRLLGQRRRPAKGEYRRDESRKAEREARDDAT